MKLVTTRETCPSRKGHIAAYTQTLKKFHKLIAKHFKAIGLAPGALVKFDVYARKPDDHNGEGWDSTFGMVTKIDWSKIDPSNFVNHQDEQDQPIHLISYKRFYKSYYSDESEQVKARRGFAFSESFKEEYENMDHDDYSVWKRWRVCTPTSIDHSVIKIIRKMETEKTFVYN